MYRKGDLKLTLERCDHPDCEPWACYQNPDGYAPKYLLDSRQNEAQMSGAFLPHSCDEWVIGGINELEDLVDDAKEAILELRRRGSV